MFITEIELREMWRDGRHPLPAFPPGTRFSPAAQDFIKDHRLEVRFESLPPLPASPAAAQPASALVHLPASNIQLLATLDTLHALALLTAAEARRYQLPALAQRLDGLAGDCLALRDAEQAGRDPAPLANLPLTGAEPKVASVFAPGPGDHAMLHWLNLLRASARQAAALAAGAALARPRLASALEQVSLAAADLGRRVQSGELGWKVPMV